MKNSCTPSFLSLGPVSIHLGESSSPHVFLFAIKALLASLCSEQSNVTWLPDWTVLWSQVQNGSWARPMRCSHCFCGPFPVLIHVYAERACLFHSVAVPIRNVSCLRASCLSFFPLARTPPSVTVLLHPAVSPK